MENPCEQCLVKACCKIQDRHYYKSKCSLFEDYHIKLLLKLDFNTVFITNTLKNRLEVINLN